jgi:threonine dehydrogenase-like Zn-dependent dehydrogenase
VEVGPNVNSIRKGDRVTGDCSCWCGECPNCKEDKNLCQNIEKYGITKDGFSQQLKVVPAKYIYVSPPQIPHEVLALTECFAVALHAIHRLGRKFQEASSGRTLIIGSGPLGMAIFILLKCLYNWKQLKIYDVLLERIAHLQKIFSEERIGCSFDINKVSENNDYKTFYSQQDYSLIFEAVGKPEALQMAIDIAKPRGTIISLGFFPPSTLDFAKVVMKSLNIMGSIGGTGEFLSVLQFFERNIPIVRSLVTVRFPYKKAIEAFLAARDRKKNIKVQILFKKSGENDED